MPEKSAIDFVVLKQRPHHPSTYHYQLLYWISRSEDRSAERGVDFKCLRALLLRGNVDANKLLNIMTRCIQFTYEIGFFAAPLPFQVRTVPRSEKHAAIVRKASSDVEVFLTQWE
jgi:hypothetical protein